MIYLIILFILFFFGILFSLSDFRKHFLLLFSLIMYFICFFLGPLNSINLNIYTHLGGNFSAGFDDTLEMYIVAIFCFIISYVLAFRLEKKSNKLKKIEYKLNPRYKYYMWFFFIAMVTMVRRNFEEEVYGGGFFNYLMFLADSLILAFIILIFEKKFSKKWHWILLAATVFIYMILGFRYRILLLLIGVIYHFAVMGKLAFKTIVKWLLLIWIIAYGINFITVNRNALRSLKFDEVTFESDVEGGMSPYQLVMYQTDNYKTEMMIMKYMHENHIEHDYGESMFLHIFIRIIPADFFENNTKPVIPQADIIRNSFNTVEGLYAGAAVSNVTEYYIAFGYVGVVLLMSLLGVFLGKIAKRTNLNVARDRVIVVLIAMVLFQEITRGYLPQNVTLLAFLLITLKLFYKKKYVSNSNQHSHTV